MLRRLCATAVRSALSGLSRAGIQRRAAASRRSCATAVRGASASFAAQRVGAQKRAAAVPRTWRVGFNIRSFATSAGGSGPDAGGLGIPTPVLGSQRYKDDKMMIAFTCTVCDTRSARLFSKKSYTDGVVIIRCPGCDSNHLIADRLGWFDDESIDIQTIMAEKGESITYIQDADGGGTYQLMGEGPDAESAQVAGEEGTVGVSMGASAGASVDVRECTESKSNSNE